MVASNNFWFGSSGFYPYKIGQSCRFNSASSDYVHFTPSGAGNRRTFTISFWTKKVGNAPSGAEFVISAHDNSTNDSSAYFGINFGTGDTLAVVGYANYRVTTPVFRDNGSWYHIVLAVDSTQSSASDRMKLYVNGSQITDLSTDTTVALNHDFGWNNTIQHRVGAFNLSANQSYYNGYVAEVYNVDGSQLTPSSFGETKEGVWIPKAYTGSYGTNGFYLKFDQTGTGTASASTIGADSSGNDNHFTSSGLGTIDSNRTDSPTNNFATWNASWAATSTYASTGTLLEGALALSSSGSASSAWSTMLLPSSGKYYVEMRTSSTVSSNFVCGVMSTDGNANRSVLFQTDGTLDLDNAQNQSGLASWVDGNTVGIRLNMDGGSSGFGEIAFYLQNSAYGTAVSISSATRPYALMTYGQTYVDLRTDPRDFAYSIPDGYSTLSTANFPEPTISPLDGEQPVDHFNTVLYSGDGNSTNDITGVGFKPSFTWIKERSADGASHVAGSGLADEVRDYDKFLSSNDNMAESDGILGDNDTRSSDGFQTTNSGVTNQSSQPYVAWNWLGANGTASNSDGDITSSVSANTTAGFSIVTWTHSGGDGQTIGHGLGATPSCIIVKNRSTSGAWVIGHSHVGFNWTNDYYQFDTGAKRTDGGGTVFGASPTSSLFTFGTAAGGNGDDHVAYCFAEVEGYSKFGWYYGNGSANGTFVHTGFRPAWLMVKRTDSTTSWYMYDNKRDEHNLAGTLLQADNNAADATSTTNAFDLVSNGFKARGTGGTVNGSGGTYAYMAFAEMPFKYANAR